VLGFLRCLPWSRWLLEFLCWEGKTARSKAASRMCASCTLACPSAACGTDLPDPRRPACHLSVPTAAADGALPW
jgi:hypothetical protein